MAAIAGWLGFTGPIRAQNHGADPAEIERGAKLFSVTCITCHGESGDMVPGVNLSKGQFRHASSDEDLLLIIRNGIPGTAMPPNALANADLVALVSYLHSMRDFQSRPVVLGDAKRGQALFEGKGACLGCHAVNGKGSRLALDLSDVGAIRSPAYLENSLLDPNSVAQPQHRFLRAVKRDGTVISGRRLNEDTYTVQLIDDKERLISLSKPDLREYSILKTAGMPSYKDKLTARERADLVAYLISLKGGSQ